MKVPSIVTTNSVKLLSGLANNDDSLAAMVVKDWIGDGATVYTYKKEGGKDDAREKAIEEFGTGAIWLFGIPAVKKLLEATVYPVFKLNPNFDPRLLNNKKALANAKDFAQGAEKVLFENLDKANPVLKKFTNAQLYKGFAVGKFAIATAAAAWGLTKIIKYKQKTTSDRISNECKKNQSQNVSFNSALINKSIKSNDTFATFTSSKKQNNQVSFTGGLAEFMYNPIKNTMILDGVIAATRLKEARKEERFEVLFKEICQVGFIYGLAKPIQLGFEKIGEVFKTPIKLDPKNLFDGDLSSKIKNSKNAIQTLKDSSNMLESLNNIGVDNPLVGLLENEGLISLTKDKNAISTLKPIDDNAIKKALDNFIDMEKNIKNLSKSKAFKTFAVVSNVLIAAGIMGILQPKMTILFRKLMYGSNENPAIVQQEKQAKAEV